jgi:hypothetical protein
VIAEVSPSISSTAKFGISPIVTGRQYCLRVTCAMAAAIQGA